MANIKLVFGESMPQSSSKQHAEFKNIIDRDSFSTTSVHKNIAFAQMFQKKW